MQQSGAAGGCGYALFPLLGILFFQGECAGWLCPTSVWGGEGRWSLFRFRVMGGVSEKPPQTFWEGRKREGGGGGCSHVITAHSVELVACHCFPETLGGRPPCVTACILVMARRDRRALVLGASALFYDELISG